MPTGPTGAGGNDPVRAAAIQNLQRLNPGGPPTQPGAPADQASTGLIQNRVAYHLAMAFNALLETGPTDENLAALEQFRQSLMQLGGQFQGGQPGAPQVTGQAPPMPGPQGPGGPMGPP